MSNLLFTLRIFQASIEEHFKLIPNDRDRVIYVLFLLILLPAETDLISNQRFSKKNLDNALSSISSKAIFILLMKVVTFYVRLIMAHTQRMSFQKLILGLLRGGRSLRLQNGLEIYYKSFLVYLGTKGVTIVIIARYGFRSLVG